MRSLLFEPHHLGHDDAVLFASYTLLRERPYVVTVFGGDTVQDLADGVRHSETRAALSVLNKDRAYRSLPLPERNPRYEDAIRAMLDVAESVRPKTIWVPLWEDGGHAQHNFVASVFGVEGVRYYATYRRGEGRTRTDTEVEPEPGWRALKYRAMACYSSQIEIENTRPWFCSDDCLREWVA